MIKNVAIFKFKKHKLLPALIVRIFESVNFWKCYSSKIFKVLTFETVYSLLLDLTG